MNKKWHTFTKKQESTEIIIFKFNHFCTFPFFLKSMPLLKKVGRKVKNIKGLI